jgi:hypothetical protein
MCALLLPQLPAATASCCRVQVCRMISNPKVTSDITRRMAACYGDRKQKEVGILRRLTCCCPHLHAAATMGHRQRHWCNRAYACTAQHFEGCPRPPVVQSARMLRHLCVITLSCRLPYRVPVLVPPRPSRHSFVLHLSNRCSEYSFA